MVAIAAYCERYQRQMGGWKRGIFYPALIIAPVLGLIFVEPDRGATMLMCAVLSVMLLFAGIRMYYFAVPAALGIVGLTISFLHDPMRSARIYSWMNLEETKREVGHQAYQASLAFGSGGWSGLGLGNGRQKMGFIPEHHTDFIFSIVGEELGIIATLLVVAAFVIIVISGVFISMRARDTFGTLLGCGITFLIGLQAAINIGVVTNTLPNKGMPLPFISYGGSNLCMMLGCVGVLISIARHARERVEKPDAFLAPDNPFSPSTA
jgi:cell division protein FtsW